MCIINADQNVNKNNLRVGCSQGAKLEFTPSIRLQIKSFSHIHIHTNITLALPSFQ